MTALFALTAEYLAAARQLADLDLPAEVVADTLEGLAGEVEEKAQSVAMLVRAIEADAEAVKRWSKDAADRAKAMQDRADALRDYIARSMQACGIQKVEGPGVMLSFRKSSAVVIDDADMLPLEFWRQPEPPPAAPDKTAIGDALKAGREVPGARVEHRTNLQIR